MSIEAALVAQVETIAPLTAIIGSPTPPSVTRIYPEFVNLRDKTFPLILYKLQNITTDQAMDGPTGLITGSLVLTVIGQTYQAVTNLSPVIVTAFDGTSGEWSGITIQGVFLAADGQQDNIITEAASEAAMLYTRDITFDIVFNY